MTQFRWTSSYFEQLLTYAAELVDLRVAVIVATGRSISALAAKAARIK